MTENELLAVLALQKAPKIGDATAKRLLAYCGDALTIFKESKQHLLKLDGIGTVTLQDLHLASNFKSAEKELRFIKDNQIDYSYFLDKNYPDRLKHCLDGPILLFQRGNINLKNKRIISIVGTRKVTRYGIGFCEKFLEALAPLDPVIVSGFAYGVDITAHKIAVHHGMQTIGCLAHGLNQIYPKVHNRYVSQLEANGGFFTDFWSSDTFDRNNFLKRNRIIAGISEATVVIESAEKGGSLVTADIANSYNREVFAVPGRAEDKYSIGCNDLIKRQKAHMLTTAADLVYMLGWEIKEREQPVIQKQLFVDMDENEKAIYSFLRDRNKEILDQIALNCNLPVHKVSSLLLAMELKGVVRPLPGKLFEII